MNSFFLLLFCKEEKYFSNLIEKLANVHLILFCNRAYLRCPYGCNFNTGVTRIAIYCIGCMELGKEACLGDFDKFKISFWSVC